MSQNRSTAVMQRRQPAPESLEYFPTPPWATRALCQFLGSGDWPRWGLPESAYNLGHLDCWEPTCGEMHMVAPLREYFGHVRASDVYRYRPDHGICDFLMNGVHQSMADFVVMNPPFKPAAQFLDVALRRARIGVAMLLRTAWSEGAERWREIFGPRPPAYELQFSQRVVMLQGRLIQDGAPDPFNLDDDGAPRKASSATSYAWFIWLRDDQRQWTSDTRKRWVPPIRSDLEQPGDYPAYAEQWAAIAKAPAEGGLL